MKRSSIALPPLAEQRRIAEILDKADALRAKRRAALVQLDTLTQSIFLDIFGDPATNPKGWPVCRLAEVLAIPLRNGLSPSHRGSVQAKVLTLSAITGQMFKSSAWKMSTFQVPPPPDQSVDELDLLICRGNGNIHLVGKAYFPLQGMPDVTFPDTMIAARVLPQRIERAFLERVWSSAAVRRQIESVARTTNGTFKVNQGALERIEFFEPPRALQDEFGRRMSTVDYQRSIQDGALSDSARLFASLQHCAFRGEL